MNQFEKFKEDFDKDYTIDKFIDSSEIPFKGELKENADNIWNDSYGNEDSKLRRIYWFPDYEIYVEFSGTQQSYVGTEWIGMKEVFPKTKTISYYE